VPAIRKFRAATFCPWKVHPLELQPKMTATCLSPQLAENVCCIIFQLHDLQVCPTGDKEGTFQSIQLPRGPERGRLVLLPLSKIRPLLKSRSGKRAVLLAQVGRPLYLLPQRPGAHVSNVGKGKLREYGSITTDVKKARINLKDYWTSKTNQNRAWTITSTGPAP
jgi:hypothetical protein